MPRRLAGLLLHPTSLPGRFGVGDAGPSAVRLLGWMADAGFSAWQVLPLGPSGRGRSPYASPSAFAGNRFLISPERLASEGLLDEDALERVPRFSPARVEYARVARWKERILRSAWRRFTEAPPRGLRSRFQRFVEDPLQARWLEDWTLFAALRRHTRGRHWHGWDADLRRRRPPALARARRELSAEIGYRRFLEFLFADQWSGLRREARRRGISLIGDVPIYVPWNSADVWAHQRLFRLGPDGRPLAVSGVPPDAFSDQGQLWRHPLYRWEVLEREGYRWWIDRVRRQLTLCDRARVDHFRGFAGFWEVPAGRRSARGGRWVPGPGAAPFQALRDALGSLPLIAEDLGEITPDVHALRRRLRLPGMKVLQFAFDEEDSEHRPEHHEPNSVVYTGTHDNDTTRGWFRSLNPSARRRALRALGCGPGNAVAGMVRAAYASPARLAVLPLQDVLELGSRARMNVPGTPRGNWTWRASPGALDDGVARRMRRLARRFHRLAPNR